MNLKFANIGYHYTTWENWLKIKQSGLIPNTIYNESVYQSLLREGVLIRDQSLRGTWIWVSKPDGIGHLGNLIRTLSSHCSTKIVLLKIKYFNNEILGVKARPLKISLTHTIGQWQYEDEAGSVLLADWVNPNRIECIAIYDMEQQARSRSSMVDAVSS